MILPRLQFWLSKVKRIDLVWDENFENSLKASTRIKKRTGTRRRVLASAPLPSNWSSFLRCNSNKIEQFRFLSEETAKIAIEDREVIATRGKEVICFPTRCNVEELSQTPTL